MWGWWVSFLNNLLDAFDNLTGANPRGMDPAAEAWRKRREEYLKRMGGPPSAPTYEAYPEVPYRPRMKLVIISGRLMEKVDLDGDSVDDFLTLTMLPARRQIWFLDRIQQARERLQKRLVIWEAEQEAKRAARVEDLAIKRDIREKEELRARLAAAFEEARKAEEARTKPRGVRPGSTTDDNHGSGDD